MKTISRDVPERSEARPGRAQHDARGARWVSLSSSPLPSAAALRATGPVRQAQDTAASLRSGWSHLRLAHALWVVLLLALAVVLVGCGPTEETGPGEVRWDRDACARCVMAVSDRNFSAQVRGGPEGKRTKLYFFDDIGCAVIWLDEQPWKNGPRTGIWVTDTRDGKWIDARTAWYVTGMTTPMDYGLGAQAEHAEGALDYPQAVEEIIARDKSGDRHPGGMAQNEHEHEHEHEQGIAHEHEAAEETETP